MDNILAEFAYWGVDGKTLLLANGVEALEPPRFLIDAIEGTDAALSDSEVGI